MVDGRDPEWWLAGFPLGTLLSPLLYYGFDI